MSKPRIETPRGKVIITKAGKASLIWNTARFTGGGGAGGGGGSSWQGRYSAAQKFVDSEVLRLSEPYTPLRTGMLIKSGVLGTEIGSGMVQWIAPYARRQYYSPRKPGSQTGPDRGPFWFHRMKAVYGERIIRGAKRIAGKDSK